MRILHRYNPYTLDFTTGEKYVCVPSDYFNYVISGVNYLPTITDLSSTANLYDPDYSYSSLKLDSLGSVDSFYRFMATSPYRSVWGNTSQGAPGDSVTIIKCIYSETTKTIYIAIFADNYFDIYKDNVLYIGSIKTGDPIKMLARLHIFPVTILEGYTEFKFVGIQGDSGIANSLGVLILNNNIAQILGSDYTNNNFTYLAESSWDVIYSSEESITQGVYFNYNTQTISLENYIGITPVTTAPPSIITSFSCNWGDGSSLETGSTLVDLTKQYSTTGVYTVSYTIYLSNGGGITTSKNITVT